MRGFGFVLDSCVSSLPGIDKEPFLRLALSFCRTIAVKKVMTKTVRT